MDLRFKLRKFFNTFAIICLFMASIAIVTPLLFIFVELISRGMGALSWSFFTEIPKPVGETGGGMKNAIIGTIYIVSIASLIGVPWGLGAGIYLSEYGKSRFGTLLRLSTDLLSGTPSIIVGIFVYALVVIPFKGFSAIAGGIALAIIILPIVIRTSEEVLKLVPKDIREAGLALGIPRWRVIVSIVVPAAKSGLITGVILGIARAAGETAPLLFTAFGYMYINHDLTEPMASLPVQIYNYAISPYQDWHQMAWAGSFVLILFVLILNLLTKLFANKEKVTAWFYREK